MVEEDSHVGPEVQLPLLCKVAQQASCLRPKRAEAFLPPLTEEPELKRRSQLKVANSEIDNFLDPATCVEHGRQQNIIASSIPSGAVDSRKDRFDFLLLKVVHAVFLGAFEGNAQNTLG